MNNQQLFQTAHQLAKATVQPGDSYAATLRICLKTIHHEQQIVRTMRKSGTFLAVFTKRTNGNQRQMLCSMDTVIVDRRQRYDPVVKGLVNVWDLEARGVRCIPLDGLISLQPV